MRTVFGCVFVAFILSACETIPTNELTAYRTAFSEASKAKDDVLIDFGNAIVSAEDFVDANNDAPAPTAPVDPVSPFADTLNEGTQAGPDALTVRRQAWKVIERYNSALSDLAEGKSDATIQASVGSFGNSVGEFAEAAGGSAIPGVGALVGMAQTAAGAIEKERRAKEFKRAVREGGPLVMRILALLQDDVDAQYEIHVALAQHDFNERMDVLTTMIGDLYVLIDTYQEPVIPSGSAELPVGAADLDGAVWLTETVNQRLNAATAPLQGQLVDYPFELAWSASNGAVFTNAAKTTVELQLSRISDQSASMFALVQEIDAVRITLRNYRILLIRVGKALTILDSALDTPTDVTSQAEEILDIVFHMKQGAERYRAAQARAGGQAPLSAPSP